MIKILIADDHPIVRRGLKQIVQDDKDMKVVSEAKNSDEVLTILQEYQIDVLLLDITMPGKSGLDLLVDLKNRYPNLPILVLSALPEESYAKRVIRMGALGYIPKESAADLLVPAIRRVLLGKVYVSSKLAEILASEISGKENDSGNLHELLSEREFEVLLLIGRAKTNSEIADLLNLSVTTISTYRTRIREKMKKNNNSELMEYCFKHKLLD